MISLYHNSMIDNEERLLNNAPISEPKLTWVHLIHWLTMIGPKWQWTIKDEKGTVLYSWK